MRAMRFTPLSVIAACLGLNSPRKRDTLATELRRAGVLMIRIGGEYQVADDDYAKFINQKAVAARKVTA